MLGVGNVVFLKIHSLFSLCMAALGVLVQNADSAQGGRWGTVKHLQHKQLPGRCLCLLLVTVQQKKSLLQKLMEIFKKLLGSG